MKGIITINPFLVPQESVHFAKRLSEEFNKNGVQVEIISDLFSQTYIQTQGVVSKLNGLDFCIYLDKDKYQSRLLEKMGVRLFNSHNAVRLCDDKAETYIALSGAGLKIPKTIFAPLCYNQSLSVSDSWLNGIAKELSFPLIVKESFGSMGKGVYLVNDITELKEVSEKLKCKPYLYQQYIRARKGVDVRVIVIGGKALCAIERSNPNDFRSNVAQGGQARTIELPKAFKHTAEKCAKILGLDYCGVDLLYSNENEPIVCEVNSNAFIGGVEGATGVNVAGAYAKYVIEQLKNKN